MAASAYKIQFMGSTSSNLKELIWKTPVLAKQKLSAWLCIQDRCLTADKLAKRGWQHDPICSLWKCQPKTAAHLRSLLLLGRGVEISLCYFQLPPEPDPQRDDAVFQEVVGQGYAVLASNESEQKCSAPITLVCWFIWTARIFDGVACTAARVMCKIEEELSEWGSARIRGMLLLSLIHP